MSASTPPDPILANDSCGLCGGAFGSRADVVEHVRADHPDVVVASQRGRRTAVSGITITHDMSEMSPQNPASALYNDPAHWREKYNQASRMHQETFDLMEKALADANDAEERLAVMTRIAERLASDLINDDCELVGFSGSGRCIEPAVAIRFEDDYTDQVCETHAQRAVERGALVVFAKSHDKEA